MTKTFQGWLGAEWGVRAEVLYDRPPAFFRQATLEEKHDLFTR